MNVPYLTFTPGSTMVREIIYEGKHYYLRPGTHRVSDLAKLWEVDEDAAATIAIHGMTQVRGCSYMIVPEEQPEVPSAALPEPSAASLEPELEPKRVRARKSRKKP